MELISFSKLFQHIATSGISLHTLLLMSSKASHGDVKQRMMNNNEISLKTEFSVSSDGENKYNSQSKGISVFHDLAKLPLPLGLSPMASFEYQAYELIFTTVHTLHW